MWVRVSPIFSYTWFLCDAHVLRALGSHHYSIACRSYYTPIALKTPGERDPHQDNDGRIYEDMCWQLFDDALFRLHNTVKISERSEAKVTYIQELEDLLRMEVRDAHDALANEKRGSSAHKKLKHRYRRYVAGRHQLLELMKQGDAAILAAIDDKVIIFQGHRWVFFIMYSSCWYNAF